MPVAPGPLIANDGKTFARTPFFDDLKRQLLAIKDLRLVVIDPLQAFVSADVNADPAAAQFLWSAMAELAAATGATVLLTHHMRKDGMMRIADGDDAREAIRGTTALVDGARLDLRALEARRRYGEADLRSARNSIRASTHRPRRRRQGQRRGRLLHPYLRP